MNNNTKAHNCECYVCGETFYLKPYKRKISKLGKFSCSKECSYKLKSIVAQERIETRLGIDNFKEWLYQKYIKERLSMNQIASIVYGNDGAREIGRYLKKFDIPIRRGSEAVKNQWVNNDERRKTQSLFAKEKLAKGEGREKLKQIMRTDEYRLKSSLAKRGKNNPMYGLRAEDSPHWNPKRTKEQRMQERKLHVDAEWRNKVFERDNYICQKCGYDKGHIIVAHHMDSYHWNEDERQDIKNGITLCEPCHKEFHSIYGYKNNFKEQTLEYIKSDVTDIKLNESAQLTLF